MKRETPGQKSLEPRVASPILHQGSMGGHCSKEMKQQAEFWPHPPAAGVVTAGRRAMVLVG